MPTPHDQLFQFAFRHACHVASWVRSILPAKLASAIDLDGMQPIRERFPGTRMRPHVADAAFVAPLRLDRASIDIVLLIEHKSYEDPGLPDQLLRYSIHVQRSLQTRAGHGPMVLPIVLQHGPRSARRQPDRGCSVTDQLRAMQPRQQVIRDDLDATDEPALAARRMTPLAELALLCLRTLPCAKPEEVPAAFFRWQHLMRAVDATAQPPLAPPLGADAIDAIGWYALAVTDVGSLRLAETFTRILDREDRTIMSTLERTFQKGRSQGLAEGMAEGKAEGKAEGQTEGKAQSLLLILSHRFGPVDATVVERVRRGSHDDIDRWMRLALDARGIEDVFGDDSTR